MKATDLLVWGIMIHLIADWLLQNHWMAQKKTNWRHLAAWIHSGIHIVGSLLVFPPVLAVLLGLSHLLLDTRLPMVWWRKTFRQTREGSFAIPVAIWGDQVAHILFIGIAAIVTVSI